MVDTLEPRVIDIALPVVVVLMMVLCPLVMGGMMLMMSRGMRHRRDDER